MYLLCKRFLLHYTSRSECYGVVAPPRIWGRGIPGTRAVARVAAHPPFRSPS